MESADGLIGELQQLLPIEVDNVAAFDDLMGRMVDCGDSVFIGALLDVIEDDFPLSGVMQSVASVLPAFGADVYVQKLAGRLTEMCQCAPSWTEGEMMKFLLVGERREELVAALCGVGESERMVASDVLSSVRSKYDRFSDACDEVIRRLG